MPSTELLIANNGLSAFEKLLDRLTGAGKVKTIEDSSKILRSVDEHMKNFEREKKAKVASSENSFSTL